MRATLASPPHDHKLERWREVATRSGAPCALEVRLEALPAPELLARDWRALEAVGNASFFTSWHWIGTLLAALPATAWPRLLRGTSAGRTIALGLLGERVVRRRYGLVRSRRMCINETGDPDCDAMTIEHNALLAAADCAKAAADALIGWFAGQGAQADELHLAGSCDRLPEALVERQGLGRYEIAKPSYTVDLDRLTAGDGDIGAVLSANARQQLRRAERHLARYGPLRLTRAKTLAEARTFFEEMKALHIVSWQRRGRAHAFTNPFFEVFHRLLIERSFASGATQLLQAAAGGMVFGYLYNFRFGARVYAYQSGFDYADAHARPGVVSHAMAIRDAFHSGAGIYDFLAGRNRLKESFATSCAPMLWQTVQQPRLAFRLERLGRCVKHAVLRDNESR